MKNLLLLFSFYFIFLQGYTQINQEKPIYQPYPENEKSDNLTVLLSLRPSEVKKVSLRKQKFTKFPSELLKFKNLEELDLSGNHITKISEEIGTLTELRKLNLSVNSLSELPSGIQNLHKLTHLDISFNLFEKFPSAITQIPNLEILNIGTNKITSIPESIGNLTNLKFLYCPFNKLTKLPKAIGKLKNLTDLHAHSNNIKNLPKEIEGLQQLMQLMLYSNELSDMPIEVSNMKSLNKIDISKNSFKDVPQEIKQIAGLKTFYLKRKDGLIPTIPDELLAHIRDNQIKTDIDNFDLSRMLTDLARRELDKKRLQDAERDKDRQARELAEAKTLEALREKELANRDKELAQAKTRAEQERAALERAEAEARQLQAEKEKEKAELEKKLAEEKSATERAAAAKEREAATKEREAANEIKKQQEKARKADEEARRQTEKLNRTIIYAALGALLFAFIFVLYVLNSNRKVKQKQREAELQREKADKLLLNILPLQVANELKERGVTEVRHFENASILFADVKGFSALASKVTPQELIKELDATFGKFDEVIMQYGLERIKTIGDCYMCVGGVPNPDPANIVYMIASALEIQNWMADEYKKRDGNFWQVRLGIHIGDLVAGVIGKTKFAYDVWGHAVNTASRMESGGEVSRVNISADTYESIKDFFQCTYRGQIEAKNIGLVDTYFVDSIKPELSINGEGKLPNEEFKRRAKSFKA